MKFRKLTYNIMANWKSGILVVFGRARTFLVGRLLVAGPTLVVSAVVMSLRLVTVFVMLMRSISASGCAFGTCGVNVVFILMMLVTGAGRLLSLWGLGCFSVLLSLLIHQCYLNALLLSVFKLLLIFYSINFYQFNIQL